MKTTFTKKLATLALSLFALGSAAQCPSLTGIYVSQNNSTANVYAMSSNTITAGYYLWNVTPSATFSGTGNTNSQTLTFPTTGTYTVCANYIDSVTMCTSSTCTVINVTNVATGNCNATFTASTITNSCLTQFTNGSTGTNLTYKWYKLPGMTLLSTQASPLISLGVGNHTIALYTYSNNQFCDSVVSVVSVNCNTTSAVCNASFYATTNASNCMTQLTNTSAGTNLTYKWYKLPSMTLLSTQNSPALSLGNGNHTIALYTYSNNQFCDSAVHTINVNCPTTSTVCNAAFTNSVLPNCGMFFMSTSTGVNLTYEWRNMTNFPFPVLSTQSSFSTTLPTGNTLIALYIYSNGQFCDSTTRVINGCSTSTNTACQVNSQFTVFADSLNPGNYFAYNQSTGNGTLSYLWNFGDGNTSTQQYPFHQYATPGQYVICLTVSNTNGTVTCTDVSCDSSSVQRISSAYFMSSIQVMAQSPTAVKEQQVLKNLSVYPNPMENELTIEIELNAEQQLNYVIVDALGKVVAKNELTSSKTVINTTTLDRGIYFLSVSGNNRILKTTKLVK